jgi:hypothetical protein
MREKLFSGRTVYQILNDVYEQLKIQDNRATAMPIFAVQQRRRILGFDPQWRSDVVWIHDGEEVGPEKSKELEQIYQDGGDPPDEYDRTGYLDEWEFVTACFTEQGCKDYIERNGHNLKEPRIYAYGSYRNDEWQAVREHLLRLNMDGVVDWSKPALPVSVTRVGEQEQLREKWPLLSDEVDAKVDLYKGVWYQSACSGLWYSDHKAAGSVARVRVDGQDFVLPKADQDKLFAEDDA